MSYTVKQLADLAGVTPRTLRYYDQIGLLLPPLIGENGYRYYDRGSLRRLQQILFFREMDVPLKEIQQLMDDPEFQPLQALQAHRKALLARRKRLDRLLDTIEQTILEFQGDRKMSEKEYFSGFNQARYEEEVRERWGNTDQYTESIKNWSEYSGKQKQKILQLGGEIVERIITEDPDTAPDAPEVQAAVDEYFQYFNQYYYRMDLDFFRGLSEMWVEDPRFAVNYDMVREGGAEFIRDAVRIYCDLNIKE
jgi:DNA-binding transcriptional MerR regulator